MLKLNLILSILILFHINSIKTSEIETFKQCLIHNLEYSREYLYTSDDININWASYNKLIKRNVFTYPLRKVNDYEKIAWTFIPVSLPFEANKSPQNYKTNYLIKSGKYQNEYLCAANEHEIFSQSRRVIKRMRLNPSILRFQFNCHWIIDKVSKIKSNYTSNTIKNLLFEDEYIYASGSLFNLEWYKRNVYSWCEKTNLNSKKFKWIIDCSKGDFLLSKK